MRSRSWSETATLVLGAVVDGVWCGALAAALAGASWPLLALFAAGVILCGALVARRLDMGGRGAGDGDLRGRWRRAQQAGEPGRGRPVWRAGV